MQVSNSKKFKIINNSSNVSTDSVNKILTHYSTISRFEDNKWVLDLREIHQNKPLRSKTIYFGNFQSEELLNEAKKWASKLVVRKYATLAISGYIGHLRFLIRFINLKSISSFSDVIPIELSKFHYHLFQESKNTLKTNLEKWTSVKKFFNETELFDQYYMMEKFIVPKFPRSRFNEEKYIPEYVAKQLDIFFKNTSMPHSYRTFYWILRLIPNRITEVASITANCLKPITSDSYVLTISSPKQSGPYESSVLKLIEIKDTGIGSYLIALIKEQVDFTKNLDTSIKNDEYLFYTNTYSLIANKKIYCSYNQIKLIDSESFSYFLKRACDIFKISDEDGNVFNPKSHQFRHNGISDRMNSGIFRAIDIKPLTAHHTTTMIEQTYTHTNIKALKKFSPIVFRGRIINTDDEKRMNRLLEKPFARRIHNLGICSDTRACNKSKAQCLRCDYLLPEFENLSYYQHDQEEWQKKKEKAEQIGNIDYADLCQDWIDSYDVAIKRVFNALSDEDIKAKLEDLQ